MPTIPQYESTGNIQARTPEPLRKEAADSFQDVNELTSTLSQIAQDWQETENVIELSTAKAAFSTKLAAIKAEAAQDPDFKNSPLYAEKINKARQDSLYMISSKSLQESASIDFEKDSAIAQIKIDSQFRQKGMGAWKVATESMIMAEANNDYATLQEKRQADENMATYIGTGVAKGMIDVAQADKMHKSYNDQQIENDIFRDPNLFLEREKEGWYDFENDKEREQKTRKAERLIKNNDNYEKWIKKQKNIAGSYDLSNDLLNGTLTNDKVELLRDSGNITDTTAAVFSDILVNGKFEVPDSTPTGTPDYFLRLLDKAVDEKADINDIILDASKAYGKGEMGHNQYAYFVNGAKERMDNTKEKGLPTAIRNFKMNYEGVKNLVKAAYTEAVYPAKLTGIMMQIMNESKSSEDLAGVTDRVMKEELEKDIMELSVTDDEMPTFNTFEEAEKADLPIGTRMLIDGVEYEVE